MALMKSLNSGISGLRAFQTKMDVIGNNIANVETVGFKSSNVSFADMLNQRLGSSGGASSAPQLTNSVGLGVKVASINRDFNQGSIQTTGRSTDIAIEGDGFFKVNEGSQSFLTRSGNFSFNKDGYLVDQAGRKVQGYNADDAGKVLAAGSTQDIKVDFESVSKPRATQNINVVGNLNAGSSDPKTISSTVYDELGKAHTLTVKLEKTQNDNEWSYKAEFLDGESISSGDTGTLNFNTKGELTDGNGNVVDSQVLALTFDPGNGASTFTFNLNFGNPDSGAKMSQFDGNSTAKVISQDGYGQGQLIDFNIDSDGFVSGIYDNGQILNLAQLALAKVQNNDGLETLGNGLFRKTTASGIVNVMTADQMSGTSLDSGALEGSNVDLAKEFTDMITSQRSYQSNARVIRTADELLQEAVNLKR